ncbi:hypothetical protein [Pseudolysinimonas sp.]|uniref:hypothetical protein n=1 Tax=Pseudolysinimonas sp. TaxID=2680009 RepID=UPI003F7E65B6
MSFFQRMDALAAGAKPPKKPRAKKPAPKPEPEVVAPEAAPAPEPRRRANPVKATHVRMLVRHIASDDHKPRRDGLTPCCSKVMGRVVPGATQHDWADAINDHPEEATIG